jgi:hypothetical protein
MVGMIEVYCGGPLSVTSYPKDFDLRRNQRKREMAGSSDTVVVRADSVIGFTPMLIKPVMGVITAQGWRGTEGLEDNSPPDAKLAAARDSNET